MPRSLDRWRDPITTSSTPGVIAGHRRQGGTGANAAPRGRCSRGSLRASRQPFLTRRTRRRLRHCRTTRARWPFEVLVRFTDFAQSLRRTRPNEPCSSAPLAGRRLPRRRSARLACGSPRLSSRRSCPRPSRSNARCCPTNAGKSRFSNVELIATAAHSLISRRLCACRSSSLRSGCETRRADSRSVEIEGRCQRASG